LTPRGSGNSSIITSVTAGATRNMATNERKSRPGRRQSEAISAGFALHPKASTEAKIAASRTKSMTCSASILRFLHISARFFQRRITLAMPPNARPALRRYRSRRQSPVADGYPIGSISATERPPQPFPWIWLLTKDAFPVSYGLLAGALVVGAICCASACHSLTRSLHLIWR